MNALEDIWGVSQIHPEINARDAKYKICDHSRLIQNECKGEELSEKSMGKRLHKIFKAFVTELKNTLYNVVQSGSEVPYFVPEPSNFAGVAILPADVKNSWLKATFRYIKIQSTIMPF